MDPLIGRTAVLFLAALVLVVAVAVRSTSPEQAGPRTDGPAVAANRTTYWPQLPVGTTFTDGIQNFLISGTRPATIEDVQVLGATPGMKVLGVRIAGSERRVGAIEILKGFPPTNRLLGPLRPAPGYLVHPGPFGVELLIGLRITAPGVQRRSGIRVIYRVDDQRYQVDFHAAIINRPPKKPAHEPVSRRSS